MALRLAWLLALFLLVSVATADDNNDDVFMVGNFAVAWPNNGNQASYIFTYVGEPCGNSTATCDTFEVKWEALYEVDCQSGVKVGGSNFQLNTVRWNYAAATYPNPEGTSYAVFNVTMDEEKEKKARWSQLVFTQILELEAGVTHMKFDIDILDYQYVNTSACLVLEMNFRDVDAPSNVCQTDNVTIAWIGDGYVQNTFDATAVNGDKNQTIGVLLGCHGNSITFQYSNFPDGSDLLHDPYTGINSSTDPVDFPNSPSPSPSPFVMPWWGWTLIGVGGLLIILAIIGLAVGGFLFWRARQQRASYEVLADSEP